MQQHSPLRRQTLGRLIALTAIGAAGSLRASQAFAAAPVRLSIEGVKGKVISSSDADYEIWRQAMVWHMSKPARRPDIIVQAKSRDDVIAAVKYAARNKLKVALRSGGHNSNGTALRDGGLLLDVSALQEIKIDRAKKTASIGTGVRSLELIKAAREQGLTFPAPHCPSVGLGGFTMGGGIGWNYQQCGGMAVHSIVGGEVITGDGKALQVSASENPDLFWALRGAGPGFFGAVSRLDLRLYPAPKAIMASSYIFPLADLKLVTEAVDAIRAAGKAERIELITVLMHHPEAPSDAPPEQAKICFFTAFAFEDSEKKARAALLPFAQSPLAGERCLMKEEYRKFDYEGLYDRFFSLDDPAGRCARYAVDNILTNDGSKALHALAEHFKKAPSRDCHVLASANMGTQSLPDSCFSWKADCFVGSYAIWDDEKDDAKNFAWLEENLPLMDPFAVGHYVNEVEVRQRSGRYPQCFSEANWQRLRELRRKYDPNGVFHDYLGHA